MKLQDSPSPWFFSAFKGNTLYVGLPKVGWNMITEKNRGLWFFFLQIGQRLLVLTKKMIRGLIKVESEESNEPPSAKLYYESCGLEQSPSVTHQMLLMCFLWHSCVSDYLLVQHRDGVWTEQVYQPTKAGTVLPLFSLGFLCLAYTYCIIAVQGYLHKEWVEINWV